LELARKDRRPFLLARETLRSLSLERLANIQPGSVLDRPDFKNRPTLDEEMLSTIWRLTTSSANSGGVQLLTGRPLLAGSSQETAMIWDDGHDSHKIRHKFFKWLHQIELATNASSSEKVGSIHFATLFEIMAIWRFSISHLLLTDYNSHSAVASNLGK